MLQLTWTAFHGANVQPGSFRVLRQRPEIRRVESYLEAPHSEANGFHFPVSKPQPRVLNSFGD